MEIIINFKGSNFTIHCCESETIQTIKIKIMQEKNIPILKQALNKDKLSSIQLEDIKTLSNYNINLGLLYFLEKREDNYL